MQPDPVADYVRRVMGAAARAEDQAILDAVQAGAGQTPPCGVRVRQMFGAPTLIAVDPTVPAWEVHEHAA